MNIVDKTKGDALNFDIKLNTDLTNWKIRAEVYDGCSGSIKVASANAGGSSADIERLDDEVGQFIVHIARDLTTCFDSIGHLEVEVEDPDGKVYTAINGEKTTFKLLDQKITWTTP